MVLFMNHEDIDNGERDDNDRDENLNNRECGSKFFFRVKYFQ